MSRRSPVPAAESRPSLSRGARMALSYLALFVFTAFALYPISRIVTIALRPGAILPPPSTSSRGLLRRRNQYETRVVALTATTIMP